MVSSVHIHERRSSGGLIGKDTLQGQDYDLGATTGPLDDHVAHQEGNDTTDDHRVQPQPSMPLMVNEQGMHGTAHDTQATTFM